MINNQDAIDKLASAWVDPSVTIPPIAPSYRYPTQEQMRSFVEESNTLNRLGLVSWALLQCDQSFCTLVSIERLLFRRTPVEFQIPVENGIVFKRVTVTPEVAVLGLILCVAFYDAGNRIAPNVLIKRTLLRAIKANAAILANNLKRYSANSNVKE